MTVAKAMLLAATACLMCCFPAYASSIVVDQQNVPGSLDWAQPLTADWAPFGQEFTPSMNSLQAAEFYLYNGGNAAATINILIHEGSIYGTTLGTSASTTLPVGYDDLLRCDFASPVSLTPGSMYTMELNWGGASGLTLRGSTLDTYPGGSMVILGDDESWGGDWAFVEGPLASSNDIPEPATLGLFAFGLMALTFKRRRA
jgi:hypothetical protein